MTHDEQRRVEHYFDLGFRHLGLTDIRRANESDVRMGTFVLCAAFIDALALANGAGIRPSPLPGGRGGDAAKWARFMRDYFGPRYRDIWDSYNVFRCLLLHNYSSSALGFTHGPNTVQLHLQHHDGVTILHRESFVRDTTSAFDAFDADVRQDDALRERVLHHLEQRPPMGLVQVEVRQAASPIAAESITGRGTPQ